MVILFFLITLLVIILGVLLSVAFFTLFERKILGLTQSRLGPNKVIYLGILQPLLDGFKLLTKEFLFPKSISVWGFFVAPSIFFIMMITLWVSSVNWFFLSSENFLVFFVLTIFGGSVYTSLMTGINSFSKFALLGGTRSAAQAISYEICLAFFVFSFIILWQSFSFCFLGWKFYIFFIFWYLLILAETNRAPFDFAEGESELISGFNVEFGSAGFVFLFLGEYGMIIFFSYLTSQFFGGNTLFFTIIVSFLVVLVRSTLPRFRYDFLMGLFWLFLLPLSIIFFFFSASFCF